MALLRQRARRLYRECLLPLGWGLGQPIQPHRAFVLSSRKGQDLGCIRIPAMSPRNAPIDQMQMCHR